MVNFLDSTTVIEALASFAQRLGTSRGRQKRLAEIAGMDASYLSRIYQGAVNLTSDQAIAIAEHFKLSHSETDFLLDLTEFERAGRPELRRYLKNRIKSHQAKLAEIETHMKPKHSMLSDERTQLYYSDWLFTAVHMLISIPRFRTAGAIAHQLGISTSRVDEVLAQLARAGFCAQAENLWEPIENDLHLTNAHPLAKLHHFNWKSKALQTLGSADPEAMNFTGLHTLSFADSDTARAILRKALGEIKDMATTSKAEQLVCLSVDFFRV